MNTDIQSELVKYFLHYCKSNNTRDFLEFKKHISEVLQKNIRASAEGLEKCDWKAYQRDFFKGRNRKWIFIDLEEIMPYLKDLSNKGINVSEYISNVTRENKAWVKYNKPLVCKDGLRWALFEVRLEGSAIPSKYFYYIPHDDLADITFFPENKTPSKMQLEINPAPMPKKIKVKPASKKDFKDESVKDKKELSSIPASNEPDEWQKFLDEQGLNAPKDTKILDDVFSSLF